MGKLRTIEVSDPALECEGLRFLTVKSPHLKGRGDITVYIPPGRHDGALPLVTLLHGVYGSHWAWAFKGGAHRIAAQLIASGAIEPVVIAMPSDGLWGDGSGYFDHTGSRFEGWVLDDVPAALQQAGLPVDAPAKSPRYIAGLSMGGFGALRLAARHPARFAGAYGMSSITRFDQFTQFVEESPADYGALPKDQTLLDAMIAHRDQLPPIAFDCGTEDDLLKHNRALHEALDAAGVEHQYHEHPGAHTWDYWAARLPDALRFFDGIGKHASSKAT